MVIDTSFLKQLDRLNLLINKRVTSNFIGEKKSMAVGKGLIFKDHRIYAPGDDFRNIDWKVFARTDDFFIKNYEEERNLVVHIIVDSSASMEFGKLKKFDYASMLALGFAYLASRNNEKVHFSTFAEDVFLFNPAKGRFTIGPMLKYLESVKPQGKSLMDKSFSHYRRSIGSKSLVIVISDFLINPEVIEQAFFHLGKQQLKVVQVLDPVEKNLAFDGECDFIDSETGSRLKSYVSPRIKSFFQKKLDEHATKIHSFVDALGGEFFQITTDTAVFDAFFRMLR